MVARRIALIAVMVGLVALWHSIPVGAQEASWQPAQGERTHFILAIDVSNDMGGWLQTQGFIHNKVPEALFRGFGGESRTPTIQSGDLLSLVYFDLRSPSPPTCMNAPGYDLRKISNLFTWQEIPQDKTTSEAKFRDFLNERLVEPCRYLGLASPIMTAEMLAPKFVAQKLDKNELFDRTFIVTATNDAYNGDPSRELMELARSAGHPVANVEHAISWLQQVQEKFAFRSSDQWVGVFDAFERRFIRTSEWLRNYVEPDRHQVRTRRTKPLFIRFTEISPLVGDRSLLVSYSKDVLLQRKGYSNGRVELVDDRGELVLIELKKSERLIPLEVQLRITSALGEAWRNGTHVAPSKKTIRLSDCAGGGACPEAVRRDTEETLSINVLEAVFGPDGNLLTNEAQMPTAAEVQFEVAYRYWTNGVYDFARVKSNVYSLRLEPRPLETVLPLIPGPNDPLTNELLVAAAEEAAAERSGEEGLTANEAMRQINTKRGAEQKVREVQRRLQNLGIFATGIMAFAALLWFLNRRYGGRRFRPHFDWHPAGAVAIDFNQLPAGEPAGSRVLAGTLALVNDGKPRWFNRFWRSEGQPHRQGALDLEVHLPDGAIALRSNPGELIGFQNGSGEASAVVRSIAEQTLVHGGRWHVFVDTGVIEDGPVNGTVVVGYPLRATLLFRPSWSGKKRDDGDPLWTESCPGGECQINMGLIPERPRPPEVKFEGVAEPPRFQPGQEVALGCFKFTSQARKRFAEPVSESFLLTGHRPQGPLPEGTLRLRSMNGSSRYLRAGANGSHTVTLAHGEKAAFDVVVHCDGITVPNPGPSAETYEFRLHGETAPDSRVGPHRAILRRDETPAKVTLVAEIGNDLYDIYWTDRDRELRVRRRGGRRAAVGIEADLAADGHTFTLRPGNPLPIEFGSNDDPHDLLFLEVGNSGRRGNGIIEIDWTARIATPRGMTLDEVILEHADSLTDLVSCRERHSLRYEETHHPLQIDGDEKLKRLRFVLATSGIQEIRSGRIEGLALEIDITVRTLPGIAGPIRIGAPEESFIAPPITGTGQRESASEGADAFAASTHHNPEVSDFSARAFVPEQRVTLCLPLSLEKLPPPHWLCIDFGTSAVTAAIGKENEPQIIPLQNIVDKSEDQAVREDRNFGEFDLDNTEKDTPFLPSIIVCDADGRQGEPSRKHMRPGFPGFRRAALVPGEASFIGLPATRKQMHEYPGRIVYSLKSWLAHSSPSVPLPIEITYRRGGREVKSHLVPLDDLVKSTFNALASAYLDDPQYQAGKLVITHPNTFSPLHRERLRRCVAESISRQFKIPPLDDRIRLVSESDAVAYYDCWQRMTSGDSLHGSERMLVYDFGAGTLDLSLIRVTWHEGLQVYPAHWEVEGRLGVPVAGNYLDEVLARLIHRLLLMPDVLAPDVWEYRYSIVSDALRGDPKQQELHRKAANDLAQEIARVKRAGWDGKSTFVVDLGDPGMGGMVGVRSDGGPGKSAAGGERADHDLLRKLPDQPPAADRPGLFRMGNRVHLSIPAREVHNDEMMQRFLRFVTTDTVEALLQTAGRQPGDVDTLLVSGRGALWPGLRDRVEQQFKHIPEERRARLYEQPQLMKEAVVRGALAWQQLVHDENRRVDIADNHPAPFAICLADNTLIYQDAWGPAEEPAPIDLSNSARFSVLQCQTARLPKRPADGDLRAYFYIDVFNHEFERDKHWRRDPRLFASVVTTDTDTTEIRLLNADGLGPIKDAASQAAHIPLRPPWPVGTPILTPKA